MKLQSLLAVITVSASYLCLVGWFMWRTVRKFGWDGLWVKGVAVMDGALILGWINSLAHRLQPLPNGILHYSVRAFDLACLVALLYMALFDRPTPWLLKRPVQWTLYAMWLLFVVVHGIKEA